MPEVGAPANPGRLVHAAAFADPAVVRAGDRWWAHAGTGPAGTVPTLSSVDLVHWVREPDALPTPGNWGRPGSVRAPEVVRAEAGRWLLYYGADCREHGVPAIGVADGVDPGGPFRDIRDRPLLCESSGRTGDHSILTLPDGSRWLFWIADATVVRARRLTGEGRSLHDAEAATVFTLPAPPVDRPRTGLTAVQVVGSEQGLLMLLSAGGPPAGIVLARSTSPDAPFVPDNQPLLTVSPAGAAPQLGSAVRDQEGRWWLLVSTGRRFSLLALDLDDGGPRAGPPVSPPTPLPPPPGHWRLPIPADPTPDQEAVLRSFAVHGQIRALPVNHTRRVVLLDLLAQLFEPGLRYPESEVDRRLSGVWAPGVHPDYARLRRLLVDHGFLDRTGGVYRRSGGTV